MSLGLSPLALCLSQPHVGGGGGSAFDYIVTTSNGGLAGIPSQYQTGGGYIGVAPGNYSGQSFTFSPSSTLYISGTDSNNMPVFDTTITGNAIGNLDISYIIFTRVDWNGTPSRDAFTFGTGGGTAVISNDVTIHDCIFRGTYRGDYNAYDTFDTGATLPEYANIPAVMSGGSYPVGDITSTIPAANKYVGDLLPDQTGVAMIPRATGGTGFAGTFDVVGGYITNAIITNGGSGYAHGANTAVPHPAMAITWTGQNPMANYMVNAVGGQVQVNLNKTLTVRDCQFQLVNRGWIPSMTVIGTFVHEGNSYHKYYTDACATGINATTIAQGIYHRWNTGVDQFSTTYDPLNPHGDFIQHFMKLSITYNPYVEIIGNESINTPNCRGDAGQFIFMADPSSANNGYTLHVVGNYGGMSAPNGITAELADNCYVYGNTVIPADPSNQGHANAIVVGLSNSSGGTSLIYGGSYIANNISERVATTRTGASKVLLENNTVTGYQSSATPSIYTTIFGDNADVYSIADIRARRVAVGAYADRGAYRDPLWINHATRTYDRSREPSIIHWPTKIGQAVSSTATSQWSRLIGGPDSVPVSITGGTFDTSTAVNNSNVSTGTLTTGLTSATLPRGIFVRANVATGATGSTLSSCSVDVNGRINTFNAITQTLSSYTQADNQDTAWNKVTSMPSFTNAEGIILACRIKADSYTNNMTIIGNSAGTNFNLLYSGNQWRTQFKNNSTVAVRFGMTQQAGTYVTLLLAVDLTKDNAGEGVTMVSDGTVLAQVSSPAPVFPSTGALRLSTADLFPSANMGILANGSGGNIFKGGMEWLWFSAYSSAASMPDITNPAIVAEFSTDKFNSADGSTGILASPLGFYYGANLGEYNSSIPNRGTSGGAAALQAGTWV